MTDIERRAAFDAKRKADGEEILKVLGEIQAKWPMLRVGQIISNALFDADYNQTDLFYVENEKLLAALKAELEK